MVEDTKITLFIWIPRVHNIKIAGEVGSLDAKSLAGIQPKTNQSVHGSLHRVSKKQAQLYVGS
jgi:hypothetical protein